MFTGIVEDLGTVLALEDNGDSARLTIDAPRTTSTLRHGESVAVAGVCLTVVELDADRFTADVMRQTLDLTTLGTLRPGEPVNLERAMAADGRFGGHLVQGHVDARTRIAALERADHWRLVELELPAELARYVVPQGSITLDGVSLTVAGLSAATFTVSLIPTTLALTTFGSKVVGEAVNVEVDVLAKYVERLVDPLQHPGVRT